MIICYVCAADNVVKFTGSSTSIFKYCMNWSWEGLGTRPNPHSWKEANLAMQSCIFTCAVAQLNSSYVSHEQCECTGLLSPGNCGQGDVFLCHIWQYAISLCI